MSSVGITGCRHSSSARQIRRVSNPRKILDKHHILSSVPDCDPSLANNQGLKSLAISCHPYGIWPWHLGSKMANRSNRYVGTTNPCLGLQPLVRASLGNEFRRNDRSLPGASASGLEQAWGVSSVGTTDLCQGLQPLG
jgi:hypothetical protein